MNFRSISPAPSISLFVKNIMVFEEVETMQKTVLPFFADGYPGLMFQETENGLWVSPHNKKMPDLFLYGQTVKPIELVIEGAYNLIIFQLYPFVLNSFFNITAQDVTDNCYDLKQSGNMGKVVQQLETAKNPEQRIAVLSELLFNIFQAKKETLDFQIREAIQMIIDNKGQEPIVKICQQLNFTERTFERRFIREVGISAKQFSSIIQFQFSMEQLTRKEFQKLTDIVYENGYADQSHFIKVFKAYTGKTPKAFR